MSRTKKAANRHIHDDDDAILGKRLTHRTDLLIFDIFTDLDSIDSLIANRPINNRAIFVYFDLKLTNE